LNETLVDPMVANVLSLPYQETAAWLFAIAHIDVTQVRFNSQIAAQQWLDAHLALAILQIEQDLAEFKSASKENATLSPSLM
jgi:hypothetical protein